MNNNWTNSNLNYSKYKSCELFSPPPKGDIDHEYNKKNKLNLFIAFTKSNSLKKQIQKKMDK